jgi:prophage antirepressor-like protein
MDKDNSITIFQNPQFGEVHTVLIDNEPWFVLSDLCRAVGLTRSASAVSERLDDGVRQMYPIPDALGRTQLTTIVSEAGLYEVVIRSDKPEAAAFRRWITSEVLPSIRKHGAYMTPATVERLMADPDFLIGILNGLKAEQAKRIQAETKVAEMEPKADFYDAIGSSADGISLSDMAKLLACKGLGPKNLFVFLRDKRVLMSDNRPYQEYIDRGLLSVRERVWYDPDTGAPHVSVQPLILGKGQDWIRKLVEARA